METEPSFSGVYLNLDSWRFRDFFEPLDFQNSHPLIAKANEYQEKSSIENHEFFSFAKHNPKALVAWVSQEAVVTNAFSQILLHVCAQIRNVHARSTFMPVIVGEHHKPRQGIATNSHPWLLRNLCISVGLDPAEIHPLPFTVEFLNVLREASSQLFRAFGVLGVGNERMLIPEYTAVMNVFQHACPNAAYRAFLEANILEDEEHTKIIEDVASALIVEEKNAEAYYEGAKLGVDARVHYYDQLLAHVQNSKES